MRNEKPFIILCIYSFMVGLIDLSYIIYLAVVLPQVHSGKIILTDAFFSFSIAQIVLNSTVVVFGILYLIFRKKFIK